MKKISSSDVSLYEEEIYKNVESGNDTLDYRPVVVGSGPCGLFAALILAENGYKPIVIERGEKIDDRVKTVQKFWDSNVLNPNSNVSFGEGGAGTFSDGKLNTLVNDKFCRIKTVSYTHLDLFEKIEKAVKTLREDDFTKLNISSDIYNDYTLSNIVLQLSLIHI